MTEYTEKRSGRWIKAQEEELECWTSISQKIQNEKYQDKKREYWVKVLNKIGLQVSDIEKHKTIEVGAGPSGLFILAQNFTNWVLLDPLIDQYAKINTTITKFSTINSDLESVELKDQFDIIVAINCIDHCDDINQFLEKLRNTCKTDGKVILAVNTHQNDWSAFIWQKANRFIEPHHPYHFTKAGYERLLSTQFDIEQTVDIEDEVIWVNKELSKIAIDSRPNEKSLVSKIWDKIRSGEILGAILNRILTIFGLPPHDMNGVGQSLYRHKLFVLLPKQTKNSK